MAMIKCPNCGKEISDKAVSCPACGEPIEITLSTDVSSESNAKEQSSGIETTSINPPKGKAKIIIPIVAVLLIAGLTVCYIFVINPMMKYSNASKLFNEGNYTEAQKVYAELGTYKNSVEMVSECDYAVAKDLLDQGKYDEAKQAFDKISTYKDSSSMSNECIYQKATSIFNEGNYEEAKTIFDSISDYKDSAEQSKGCTYQIALDLYNLGDEQGSIKLFVEIMDYADTKKYVYKVFDKYAGNDYINECASGITHLNNYLNAQSQDLLDFIYDAYWGGNDTWSPDMYHTELKAMQESRRESSTMESDFNRIFTQSLIDSCNDDSLKTVYSKYKVVKNDMNKLLSTTYAMEYIYNLSQGIDNTSQLVTIQQHMTDYTNYYNSIEK